MEKIEAVIFDLEGVIVNSEPIWTTADLVFLGRHGVDITFEEYEAGIKQQLMGLVLRDGILLMKKQFGFTEEPARLAEERRAIVRNLFAEQIDFINGFSDFHNEVRQTKKTAVATSLERAFLVALDQRLGLSQSFNGNLYSVEDIGSISKPDPAIFRHAAKELQVSPTGCLVIEDAPNGIEAAKRAGMRCIALTTSSPREKLTGADLIVDYYHQIDLARL